MISSLPDPAVPVNPAGDPIERLGRRKPLPRRRARRARSSSGEDGYLDQEEDHAASS
jgi:hypothetical protein